MPVKLAVGAIVTVGIVCGTAYATVLAPAAGTVHACAKQSNGALRAVAGAGSCKAGEHALSWNVAGRPGANGQPGPAGAAGPAGPAGAAGATGPQGPAASDGLNGATGPQGPAGSDGLNGGSVVTATDTSTVVDANAVVSATASCPAGHIAISGGFLETGATSPSVIESHATPDFAGWVAKAKTQGNAQQSVSLTVYAYCVLSS